jgi:hypothetical protein
MTPADPNAPISGTTTEQLQNAGAIGANTTEPETPSAASIGTAAATSTSAPKPSAVLPTVAGGNTIGAVINSAITAAASAATAGGSSPGTVAAVDALSHGLIQLAEAGISAVNPIAGDVAGLAGGTLEPVLAAGLLALANDITELKTKIGLTVNPDVTTLSAWLSKL